MIENNKIKDSIINVNNPHDKLFKETWSNLENVRSFLKHYLPANVLKLMVLKNLEICKDSFVEKELADYFSDMLYKITLSGTSGYVYILFEHKSYYDKYVHLQLLEYMTKIWRLFLKQQQKAKNKKAKVKAKAKKGKERKKENKKESLPIIIPLLICHGDPVWSRKQNCLSSLLAGPVEELSSYIPDFNFELYDLTAFSDDEIKGTVMTRVVMLLFKHIYDPDLLEKLPDILSLMQELMTKETGLQYIEAVLRYLFNTVDDVSTKTIKEIVEKALSNEEGDKIMTLATRLRMEGREEGIEEGLEKGREERQEKGEIKGLIQAIELGILLKFPDKVSIIMNEIYKINNLALLQNIIAAIRTAKNAEEIMAKL